MTASLTIMARALHAELLARGWAPPIAECEEIARSMVARTAEVAERVRERTA